MAGKRRIRRRWVALALLAAAAGGAAWCYFGLYCPSRVDVQIADFVAEPNRRNAERLAKSFLACKGTDAERSEILNLLTFPRVVTRSAYPPDRDVWIALEPSPWAGLLASIQPGVQLQPPSDGKWEYHVLVHPDGRVSGPSFSEVVQPFAPQAHRYLGVRKEDIAPGPWVEELPILCFAFPLEPQGWAWPSSRAGWARWIPRRDKPMGGRYDSFRWTGPVELNIVAPGEGETIKRLEGKDMATAVRKAVWLDPAELVYPLPGNPLPADARVFLEWKDAPADCVFNVSYRGLEGIRGPGAPDWIVLRGGSSGKVNLTDLLWREPVRRSLWAWFERPNTPDGYTGAIILTPSFEGAWMLPEVKALFAETIELPVKVTVAVSPLGK